VDDLNGDEPIHIRLVGPEDRCHTAAPNFFEKFVGAEFAADHDALNRCDARIVALRILA
jgi:hypothetical protein